MIRVSQNMALLAAAAAGVLFSAIPVMAAPVVSGPFSDNGSALDPIYSTATLEGGVRYRGLNNGQAGAEVVVGLQPANVGAVGFDPIGNGAAGTTAGGSSVYNASGGGTDTITIDYTAIGGTLPSYLGGGTATSPVVSQNITKGNGTSSFSNSLTYTGAPTTTPLNWLLILESARANPTTITLSNATLTETGSATVTNLGTFTTSNTSAIPFSGWDVTGIDLTSGFDFTAGYTENSTSTSAETNKIEVAFGSVPVPEPVSAGLLGFGAMGLLARRRRA